MAEQIGTEATKAMLDGGAQVVEVLPAEAYDREHLPGAVSMPLADIAIAPQVLDPGRPVIVYCFDHQCDLSPRAAAYLEAIGRFAAAGFTDVVVHQIGPDQDGFFRFYADEVLPAVVPPRGTGAIPSLR